MTKRKTDSPVFSKQDLLRAKRYSDKRDILNALLKDGETYTIEQVDKTIKTFLSKEVK